MRFFFQAECGIRYSSVTGVQTCALPISVLLAPADEFAGEEQQRTLAAIDQNKLVDGSASGLRSVDGPAIARASQTFGALLPDEHFAGGKSFLESEEETGVLVVRTDYRKNGNVFVSDRIEKPPCVLSA